MSKFSSHIRFGMGNLGMRLRPCSNEVLSSKIAGEKFINEIMSVEEIKNEKDVSD